VQTGVKVVGVQRVGDSDPHSKRFVVTCQKSRGAGEGGDGSDGEHSPAQAGLKSRRSSLYAGLGSEDYQPSAAGDSAATEEAQQSGAGGAAGRDRVKETFTLPCDGIIMATGSSR
jgi:hypothetical protein